MPCAICTRDLTVDAHVKPKRKFDPSEDDRSNNIIQLCPNHHSMFDDGRIGICNNRIQLIIQNKSGDLELTTSEIELTYLEDEYVAFRNKMATYKVRFRLGKLPGHGYGQWCDVSSVSD